MKSLREIEEILHTASELKAPSPNPFFTDRLIARINRTELPLLDRFARSWKFKVACFIVIGLNVAFAFGSLSTPQTSENIEIQGEEQFYNYYQEVNDF